MRFETATGSETVIVGPMAIIGYETENRTKLSRVAETGFGVTDMTDLAWRQLVLENRVSGTLDEFRLSLIDIDPVTEPDPT